jgi:hypothetical protein
VKDFAVDKVISGGFGCAQVENGFLDFGYREGFDREVVP